MKPNQAGGDLKALHYASLKNVDDFLYLGWWIDCSSKDANVRIGKACPHFINWIQLEIGAFLRSEDWIFQGND